MSSDWKRTSRRLRLCAVDALRGLKLTDRPAVCEHWGPGGLGWRCGYRTGTHTNRPSWHLRVMILAQ